MRRSILALALLGTPLLAHGQTLADITLVNTYGGASAPTAMKPAADGTGRVFITERSGRVRVGSDGNLNAQAALDITAQVDTDGEGGLLGIALHPDFASNGRLFLSYLEDDGNGNTVGDTIVAEYAIDSGDPNLIDPGSAVEVLRTSQPFSNHNGGDIHFGGDGFLYIGLGDGGSGNDPQNNAQNTLNVLGAMLRVDVDSSNTSPERCALSSGYAIPADNPYAGSDSVCDEIWAYGLRNPYRFSFDPWNGDLFIGDVGQSAQEEVDYRPASAPSGVNFEWSCREGNLDNTANGHPCAGPGTLTGPVLTYPRGVGVSITGGHIYRGPIPALRGHYVFADFGSGTVFRTQPGDWQRNDWLSASSPIAFGQDANGELYVLTIGGTISRFTDADLVMAGSFEQVNSY